MNIIYIYMVTLVYKPAYTACPKQSPFVSSRPARCRDSILHPGGRLWTDWQNSGLSFLGATVTAVIRWWGINGLHLATIAGV